MNNRFAIIENGIVKNVVDADPAFAAQHGWVACPDGGPGWAYANGTFIAPAPDLEVAGKSARANRDKLLVASDLQVIKAAEQGLPLSQPWRDYRQALRDVPKQQGFPLSINWPVEPA